MASLSRVIYVGFTDCLVKRTKQHKVGFYDGFSKKYKTNRLVYWESFYSKTEATSRERQLKGLRREKKVKLINSANPEWKDFYSDVLELQKRRPVI